jgi:hypothetical protein
MSYDIRLLTKSSTTVPLSALEAVSDDCRFEVMECDQSGWTRLLVTNARGNEICILERASRRTMARELDGLLDDLAGRAPRSAAAWTSAYLRATRAVYGCSLLSFGSAPEYAGVPAMLLWAVQEALGDGILHVDGQGYSNTDGYQITWEFSERVTGPRQMAVLGSDGRWHPFEMDLSDKDHRAAFQAGEMPFGLEVAPVH